MLPRSEPNLRVVLLGLPADIADSPGQAVSKRGAVLHIAPHFPILRSLDLLREAVPDVVFVWTGEDSGASLLEIVRRAEPQVPAVAVNSQVKNREIFDALDSGTVNYNTPRFDTTRTQRLPEAAEKAACCC